MNKPVSQLSAEGSKLVPVSRSGYLVEADVQLCGEAIVFEYRRRFIEFEHIWHLPIPVFRIEGGVGDLISGLKGLFPLASAPTRYLVVPTSAARWSAVFFNSQADQQPEFLAGLNRKVAGRVIYYFDREHSLKKVGSNRYIGHYGGSALWLFVSGKPLEPDRAISCVRETSGWKFDQYGKPLPFEKVERYSDRIKRNRFNSDLLRSYLRELAVDPFNFEAFSVSANSPGILIEREDESVDIKYIDQSRIEREWYKEMEK